MRLKALILAAMLLFVASNAYAQITIPNTFTPFTLISAAQFNTNFNEVGTKSLNRTGGTITGNIAVNTGVTIDGVDISSYLLGSGKAAVTSSAADALKVTGGLTIGSGNVALVGTDGRIPALSSTYFASLDTSNLTLDASLITSGTISTARLGSGSATNTTFLRGDQTWATVTAPETVPTGAVVFMDGACASGYSEFTTARGRYIVGMPNGGTLDGTVGSALTNLQNPTHTHSVPALSVPALSIPALTFAGVHFQTTTAGGTTSSDGAHTHGFSGTTDISPSFAGTQAGSDIAASTSGHSHDFSGTTGSSGAHTHTFPGVNAEGTTSGGSTSTGSTGTGSTGTGTSGASAGTDAPYIQLRACKKD